MLVDDDADTGWDLQDPDLRLLTPQQQLRAAKQALRHFWGTEFDVRTWPALMRTFRMAPGVEAVVFINTRGNTAAYVTTPPAPEDTRRLVMRWTDDGWKVYRIVRINEPG